MDAAPMDLKDPQIGSIDPCHLTHLDSQIVDSSVRAERKHVLDRSQIAVPGEEVDREVTLLLWEWHGQVHEGVKGY